MPCCAALLRKPCEDMLSSDLQKLKLLEELPSLQRYVNSSYSTSSCRVHPHNGPNSFTQCPGFAV